jgi:hypothetical protein
MNLFFSALQSHFNAPRREDTSFYTVQVRHEPPGQYPRQQKVLSRIVVINDKYAHIVEQLDQGGWDGWDT